MNTDEASDPATTQPVLAIGAVVFDGSSGEERVLLIRRGRAPQEGRLSLPGGRVQLGERLADAVRRELLEETGLHVRPGPLVAVAEIIDGKFHYVVLDYLCRAFHGELRAGDDATFAGFFPVKSIQEAGVTDAVHDVVLRGLAMKTGD